MARLHYNLLQAVLDGDIDDNDLTITFTAPLREWGEDNIATITAPDVLAIRIGYELLHITAYTSGASSATVIRGQEGSTATAHAEGDAIRHVITDLDLPDLSSYAPLASPTFTGEATAPSFQATGKTGATATPIRLAGGTASGSPASGAHLKGEIVFDDAGVGYYCTVAGTPGTWVSFSGGGGGGGSVATDAIWDAAGDLAVGTGSNTAAKLAIGAALRVLRVNSGSTALEWADLAALYAPVAGAVGGPPRVIRKTADESVTSSTSLQDDDTLFTAMGASEVWVVEFTLYIEGATAPGDFDPAINLPAGATMRWAALGLASGATSGEASVKINSVTTVNSAAAGTFGAIGSSPATMVIVRATVVNSTTPGNIQLRWAQGGSSGTPTKVLAGSVLMAWRLV